MSVRHPNISAWQRESPESGYTSELGGFALRVNWTPNTAHARGAFEWIAERPGAKPHRSHAPFEELSEAMADAEEFARDAAAKLAYAARH